MPTPKSIAGSSGRGIHPLIAAKAEPIRSRVPMQRSQLRYQARHPNVPRERASSARLARSNTDVSCIPKRRTVRVVHSSATAFSEGNVKKVVWSAMTIQPCSARRLASAGPNRIDGFINATAGHWRRASTVRRAPGAASPT